MDKNFKLYGCLSLTVSAIALHFIFARDAAVPVICGVSLLCCGTCTQGPQHADMKQTTQSVTTV